MNFFDRINIIHEKLGFLEQELETIKMLSVFFPDLEVYPKNKGWGMYQSKSVNPIADKVSIYTKYDFEIDYEGNAYGESTSIVMTPYVLCNGVKVCTNPVSYYLGEIEENSYGESWAEPAENLQTLLKECDISENICRKVKEYFDKFKEESSTDSSDYDIFDW